MKLVIRNFFPHQKQPCSQKILNRFGFFVNNANAKWFNDFTLFTCPMHLHQFPLERRRATRPLAVCRLWAVVVCMCSWLQSQGPSVRVAAIEIWGEKKYSADAFPHSFFVFNLKILKVIAGCGNSLPFFGNSGIQWSNFEDFVWRFFRKKIDNESYERSGFTGWKRSMQMILAFFVLHTKS